MKLTDCIQFINQALNYPAITYEDLSVYFDMAIAELNTTLHTDIPVVSEMIKEFRHLLSKRKNMVKITDPNATIPTTSGEGVTFYYDEATNKYVTPLGSFDKLYAVCNNSGKLSYYETIKFPGIAPQFIVCEDYSYNEADLGIYLTSDWVLLWLVPYVCFKYTVRDGGTASTFAEELTQGFQQLQDTYDVPGTVLLTTYADHPAYFVEVEKRLPNLNVRIGTRAITDYMKHVRNVNAIYGSLYDNGGFGL